MERKTVAALGGTAALGLAAGSISLDGVSINLAEASPVLLMALILVALVVFMIISLVKGWVIVKLHYDTILKRAEAAEEANVRLSERAAILTDTNNIQARALEQTGAVGDTVTKLVHAIQDARTDSQGVST